MNQSVNHAKDFWNQRYSQKEFIYGEKPNQYLKEKLEGLPVGRILLPAEGEGRNGVFAAWLGWKVSAFDQSEEGKRKAEQLAVKNQVHIDYQIADLENVRYPENTFDALALVYAHFHSTARRDYHRKLAGYVKKGGVLILEAFGKQHADNQKQNPNAGGPRNFDMLYDLAGLKSDFEGFELIESIETTIQLDEGNYHRGKASVVRVYAIKQ
ncbi:MAG: methyltransferase [Cytophagaceae bacterium SCN 52-12]|nr:MAG: methyltransferase [Cytophagaceae bacterium SCN 52-12]